MIKDHLGRDVVWVDEGFMDFATVRECLELAAVESIVYFLYVMAQDQ